MRRIEKLEARRIDQLVRASMTHEVYKTIRESESIRYALGAMQPIDPEYTKNTFTQGERVKSQLEQRLPTACEYEFQGSITTDTHIKARSDIDLLTVRKDWYWLEPPQRADLSYAGDPAADMRGLRKQIVVEAGHAFPKASIDDTRSTSVKLSGGSLSREVDIVPSARFRTKAYAETKDPIYIGVKVFNKNTSEFTANTPRLHARRIELRDQAARGGLRRACRLLKTLMYDSDRRVDMTSYNILGLAYNIPEQNLITDAPRDLAILEACFEFCTRLSQDATLLRSIRVPDGHRTVFGDGAGATTQQLSALIWEIADLRREILAENAGAFQRLAEARVIYSRAS